MSMPVNVQNMNLFIDRSYNTHITNTTKSIEKLSTGKRVNRAGDDVAALSISAKADSQIKGSSQAKKNIVGAMGILDEANTKLSTAFDLISNIRELYVQGLNGTNSQAEVDMIQRQIIEYQKS